MKPVKLPQKIEKTLDDIRQTRDEIRLQLHLANLDARVRWEEEYEPMFLRAEKVAAEVSETAFEALGEIARKLRDFRTQLRESERHAHP